MGGAIAPKNALFNKNYTTKPHLSPPIFRVKCNPKLLKM